MKFQIHINAITIRYFHLWPHFRVTRPDIENCDKFVQTVVRCHTSLIMTALQQFIFWSLITFRGHSTGNRKLSHVAFVRTFVLMHLKARRSDDLINEFSAPSQRDHWGHWQQKRTCVAQLVASGDGEERGWWWSRMKQDEVEHWRSRVESWLEHFRAFRSKVKCYQCYKSDINTTECKCNMTVQFVELTKQLLQYIFADTSLHIIFQMIVLEHCDTSKWTNL